jgi:hypothetical protein
MNRQADLTVKAEPEDFKNTLFSGHGVEPHELARGDVRTAAGREDQRAYDSRR